MEDIRTEKVTIFGLSASYIHALMAEQFLLKSLYRFNISELYLKLVLHFQMKALNMSIEEIKTGCILIQLQVEQILTDVFLLGNPISPVYVGELQGAGLGMKINSYNEKGEPVRDEQRGACL